MAGRKAGQVGAGAVAAVTAMALRVAGHAHWVMWEVTTLFESVAPSRTVSTPRPAPARWWTPRRPAPAGDAGRSALEQVRFAYQDGGRPVIDGFSLTIRPGEHWPHRPLGVGKSTLVNLLLRFRDIQGRRVLIDGQGHFKVTQDSLRHAIGMVTQDTFAAAPFHARQHPLRPP